MLLFIQLSSSNVSALGFNFQFRHGGGLARAAHWITKLYLNHGYNQKIHLWWNINLEGEELFVNRN